MTAPAMSQDANAIGSVGEAEAVISNLGKIMDALLSTVEQETELVRAGRLSDAGQLETAKAQLTGQYLADTERLKASRTRLERVMPEALDALRKRHETFNALLQINLAVLATAHAVSEGIIRGVSDEMSRKQGPTTYGASGRPNAAAPKSGPPLAVCRSL
ncbi:MAG: hypothetical protein JO254_15785 [Pseudolabrys sp.]|nr:hypothetical protein [Pseudolabrys sp.]